MIAALFAATAFIQPATAVEPDEILADPVLESRARVISKVLRCLVCQNQSIDDSSATLARDLRILVRDRLKSGDTNEQITEFVVARYGNFVLLNPPVEGGTLILWAGPGALLVAGAFGIMVWFRRRRAVQEPPPLSPEEQARLDALLATDQDR
jgi:cytochrome c-type biogenesis protein CcmH